MTFECWCKTCDKWQSTGDVEFVDVSENAYGEDSFTFICPGCDEKQTSLVHGDESPWRLPHPPYPSRKKKEVENE